MMLLTDAADCTLADAFAWMDTVPWILVIFGWAVALKQANRHDNRVDARAAIDRILDLLGDLEKLALEYHLNSNVSNVDALVIKSQIERISSHIRSLNLLSPRDFRTVFLLRQSITLQNFDSVDHQAQSQDSMLLYEIGHAINTLSTRLEELYRAEYG